MLGTCQTAVDSTVRLQYNNNIAMRVTTSTYNTEKVYRGSSAPSTLYTNMLWLDTSVSPNLLKRYTGSVWVIAGAQEVKSSGIYIGPNKVAITTENFLLQLLDPSNNENVLMEMSANGNVGFKELYAERVVSNSVAAAYRQLCKARDNGRILTPDGLRVICEGLNRNPEAIGKHMLEVLARIQTGK